MMEDGKCVNDDLSPKTQISSPKLQISSPKPACRQAGSKNNSILPLGSWNLFPWWGISSVSVLPPWGELEGGCYQIINNKGIGEIP